MKNIYQNRRPHPLPLSIAVVFAVTAVTVAAQGAAINPNDIMIFQVGDSTTHATTTAPAPIYIQEINPLLSNQTTPVQSFSISTNTSTALWGSDDGSAGLLGLSDNGTLLTFSSWIGQTTIEDNTAARGAGVIDSLGNYTQPSASDYTNSATGSQSRGSYTPDGTTFYFADKSGIYTNGGTTPLNATNIRSVKDFGGQLYALSQNTTPELSTVSLPSGSLTGVTGLPVDSKSADFVLLSSHNNSTMDTLYVVDSGSSGKLLKFSLVAGSWTAEGSGTSIANLDAITGEVDSNGHFDLYLTIDPSAGGGSVEEMTDSALSSASPSFNAPTTLYTAPTGDLVQGVSLAPTPEPSTWTAVLGGLGMLFGCRKLRRTARRA